MAGELAKALAQVQAQIPRLAKAETANITTKDGGTYSYSYATLADVTAVILPLLGKQGLAWVCRPTQTETGFALIYTLMHESGETIDGQYPLAGTTQQAIGSAITYARRYCLSAVTGIAADDEDDDAAAASQPTNGHIAQHKPPPGERTDLPVSANRPITDGQVTKMQAMLGDLGFARDDHLGRRAYAIDVIGRDISSSKEMTVTEASLVIDRLKDDLRKLKQEIQ